MVGPHGKTGSGVPLPRPRPLPLSMFVACLGFYREGLQATPPTNLCQGLTLLLTVARDAEPPTPSKKKLEIITLASNYHVEVNPATLAYDTVCAGHQDLASVHQLTTASASLKVLGGQEV
ncbi:hypothetical protein GWK47_027351 [Chionoecetes opilio]|uniref:Uncharacterized protein n=1 Tax=Chionoecetes opilio TaxID=41210 RepID=A0A8J8WBR8_CHIOP|nr:hypothetical protein GWK47_027351 [Chionoecetes opilio]